MKLPKTKTRKQILSEQIIDLDAEMGIFHFLNGREENKKFPDTFKIFNESEYENIKVGDSVKVNLRKEPFWVSIIEIADNKIYATINSLLFINRHLDMHTKVNLKYENILDIYPQDLHKFPEALQEIKDISNSLRTNIKRLEGNFNNPYFITSYNRHKNKS